MIFKVWVELLSLFFLGSIPCFIALLMHGVSGMIRFLKSIDISNPAIYYALALFLIQFVVSLLGKYKAGQVSGVKERFKFYYAVVNNIGTALTCIYRVVAGASLTAAIVMAFHYQEAGVALVVALWVTWPVMMVGGLLFNGGNEYAVELQR